MKVIWQDLHHSDLARALLLLVALTFVFDARVLAQEKPIDLDVKRALQNRECAQPENEDEVVVCARPQDGERYRIPKNLRDRPVTSVPQHVRVLETPTCLIGNITPCGKPTINIFSIKAGKAKFGPQQQQDD